MMRLCPTLSLGQHVWYVFVRPSHQDNTYDTSLPDPSIRINIHGSLCRGGHDPLAGTILAVRFCREHHNRFTAIASMSRGLYPPSIRTISSIDLFRDCHEPFVETNISRMPLSRILRPSQQDNTYSTSLSHPLIRTVRMMRLCPTFSLGQHVRYVFVRPSR